ncbi:hypothetical protein B0H14DRAFT_3888768 [Mycena olivaceomarginata]|nr:hypothetical protein B0H14DRAFT_3888768 [Mycena olivaceomarginata]
MHVLLCGGGPGSAAARLGLRCWERAECCGGNAGLLRAGGAVRVGVHRGVGGVAHREWWEDRDPHPPTSRVVVHFTALITPAPLHRVLRPPYFRRISTDTSNSRTAPRPTHPSTHRLRPCRSRAQRARQEYAHRPPPRLKNVVRRLIVECASDAADADAAVEAGLSASRKSLDPAMRAARMSLADVVQQLREEEKVWSASGSRSGRRRGNAGHGAEGCDDSYGGMPRTSDTSPVLSRSTLGTTLSPPPLGEREHEERQRKEKHAATRVEERETKPTIPVSPVLNHPRLLRPIPYIPETIAHLPPHVANRAMTAQQAAQGGNVSKAATSPATTTISVPTRSHPRCEGE